MRPSGSLPANRSMSAISPSSPRVGGPKLSAGGASAGGVLVGEDDVGTYTHVVPVVVVWVVP